MSWSSVPAAELMVKRGGSVNPSKFPDETFELLSIPAFDKDEPEILKGSEIGSSKSCIEPGDVLLSKIVPHIRRCWVVPNKGEHRQIGSSEWIIFRDDRFDSGFLRHFLTSNVFHSQFMNTVAGVGGSLVRARPAGVELIDIPLPPLAEQKRIAAILDKADAIRRKRQQAIQLADEFLRSVFLDMFGDPVTNPKGWKKGNLDQYLVFLTSGSRGWAKYYSDIGSKFIRIQNVGKNKLLLTDMAYVDAPAGAEATRTKVAVGDVLLSITADLGRAAVVTSEITGGHINQHLAIIRSKRALLNPRYLAAYLSSDAGLKQFMEKNKSAVKAGVNFTDIRTLEIMVPPIEKQQQYENIYEKLMLSQARQDGALEETRCIFNSLNQKSFAGKL